jgi:hypothetical protein
LEADIYIDIIDSRHLLSVMKILAGDIQADSYRTGPTKEAITDIKVIFKWCRDQSRC